jgi:DNA mismatch endonuclease (patch repair protein)
MADIVSPEVRSRIMAGIRGRDTLPELRVRSQLHKAGLRFRLHRRDLPGRPDIVLPQWNAVIFVHGCFWHRHSGCPKATMPATNHEFWTRKFQANVQRDARNRIALRKLGWKVYTVWECRTEERQIANIIARITMRSRRSWANRRRGRLPEASPPHKWVR